METLIDQYWDNYDKLILTQPESAELWKAKALAELELLPENEVYVTLS